MSRWILLVFALRLAGCTGGDGGSKPEDSTPPRPVADLIGSLTSDSAVALTWTAPGDDGSSGTADRYDLRWSRGFVTDGTWASARQCEGLPKPREAGSVETYAVTDLPRTEPVRLALKTIDEAGNASAISNVVTVRLPPAAPICSLSVEGMSFGSIPPHETRDQSFTITNVGGGRLEGEVGIAGERFSLVEGGGSFSLGYRDSRPVTVRFTPGISGPAEGSVNLGLDGCGPLPCSGQGSGSYCIMDWDTVRFGNVNVGEHREWRVTLTNRGDHWTVVTPQLEGCTGMRVPYDQSFTLQPGQVRSLGVEFLPRLDGPVDCRLKLNAQGECDEVVLLGTGIGPRCWLSADGHGFGPVPVGTAVEWPFRIENQGGGEVQGTVSAPASPDFQILSGAGPYTLLAGQTRMVRVRFAPQSGGEKSWVVDTGTDACLDVQIWGTGLAGECSVEPDTLDFGNVAVGSIPEANFTIANRGAGTLSGFVPMACEDFAVASGWGSFSLEPGETKTCRVRFRPLTTGEHECFLTLGLSCPALTLRGAASGELCRVQPTTLDFGTIPAWSEAERTFVLTNVGGGTTLTGTIGRHPCPQFTVVRGDGTYNLAPGESREVAVRFSPDVAGPYSCAIRTGTDVCPTVPATGNAVGAICEITPPSVVFPSIRPRADADTIIVIRNIGGGMIVGQPSLSCADYSIVSGGGVIQLAHGESHALRVRWSPIAEGPSACALRIGSTCDSVPLSGTCIDIPPAGATSVDTLGYGLATVGRAGQTLQFRVRNDGGRVLTGSVASTSPEFVITQGEGSFQLRAWEEWRVAVEFRPAAVGERTGTIALGLPGDPAVACVGTGLSYRILAEMSNVDDEATLAFNGGPVRYTARYGRLGTEEAGWTDYGHRPGRSGTLDITSDLVQGANRVHCVLTNVRQEASVRLVVSRPGETLIEAEYHDGSAPGGIVYAETFEIEVEID